MLHYLHVCEASASTGHGQNTFLSAARVWGAGPMHGQQRCQLGTDSFLNMGPIFPSIRTPSKQLPHAGTLKLLDVNMFGWPAHTGRPAIATAAECCYACADTPGCNIWNFCPQKGGCGTGCTVSKFGPTGTKEQAHNSYVSLPLPSRLRSQLCGSFQTHIAPAAAIMYTSLNRASCRHLIRLGDAAAGQCVGSVWEA